MYVTLLKVHVCVAHLVLRWGSEGHPGPVAWSIGVGSLCQSPVCRWSQTCWCYPTPEHSEPGTESETISQHTCRKRVNRQCMMIYSSLAHVLAVCDLCIQVLNNRKTHDHYNTLISLCVLCTSNWWKHMHMLIILPLGANHLELIHAIRPRIL